ncbi:hypothetical protein HRbin36_01652 [bacterium HR36]|nr:hypothetical protein HRbin36_01652 [bacterium HR36]
MAGQRAARQLARRLRLVCGLRGAVWWGIVATFVWGSAVVIARLTWPVGMGLLLAGIGLVLVVSIAGAVWCARKAPHEEQLLALLDAENTCGGMLMSAREAPLDGWLESVSVQRVPVVSWNKRRALVMIALSGVYVGLALFLPQRYLRPVEAGSLAAEREVEKLQQQLEKLRELGLVDAQRFHELQVELQEVRKNASAVEPGKTQEALDHLEQVLKRLAVEGLEKRQEQRQLIQQAKELTDALRELSKSGEMQPRQAELASQALEKLLQEVSAGLQDKDLTNEQRQAEQADDDKENKSPSSRDEQLAKQLQELLGKHVDGAPFSDQELDKLSDLLRKLLDNQGLDLQELADLGLIDPEWLKNLERIQIDPEKIKWIQAELLKLCEGDECDLNPEELLLLLARCGGMCRSRDGDGLPGRGGINRGRADAELTFGQPSSAEGVHFKPELLKPGALHNWDTQLKQVRRVKPNAQPRETSEGGALKETQGVGEGHQRQILPRHRSAVRQYFESGR